MSEQVLDDQNIIAQRDPDGALELAAHDYEQVAFQPEVKNGEHDGRELQQLVITGMGGSALAALLIRAWLKTELKIPFEVIRSYSLPAYVGSNTLVIASSYSGNTEETLSAYKQAMQEGAQVAVVAAGGALIEQATADNVTYSEIPSGMQPRMALIYNLQAVLAVLEHFGVVSGKLAEVQSLASWLEEETKNWVADQPTATNLAKQVAQTSVGKNAVFYGGELTAPIAYKWKISWNETGKNIAFWNEYSEFNHNEFMGWTSHPVEKPFVVFDLISHLEHPQILKRFEISDRLLSGKRPKANTIELKGETLIAQLLWGVVLADFTSVYLAILNNVNPTPVALIEKLKKEL
jgi:glucose/mannose-6-phosphate isomerase